MSHTSPTAVFVTITAKDCGACQKFKLTERDDLFSYLRKHPSIKIEEISVGSMSNPKLPTSYHPDLKKLFGIYPCFGMVPYDSWTDHQSSLNITILGVKRNGKNGQLKYVGGVPITADGVYGWIKDQVQTSMFAQSPLPIAPRPGMVYTMPVVKQYVSYRPGDDLPIDY